MQVNSFFRPEKVWNVEGGAKTDLLDRRLRLNGSAYYYKYTDRQQISLESIAGSGVPQYVTISGDSEAWGIDLDARLRVTDRLSVSGSGGYIDSKWTKRVERRVDIAGQPTGEPFVRVVAAMDYELPMGATTGTLRLHADHSVTGARRLNAADRAGDAALVDPFTGAALADLGRLRRLGYRGERNLTNARLTWLSPGERFEVAGFVENLFDNRYVTSLNDITAATLQTPYVRVNRPRLYGIELAARF